jgi:RHS repeat-associated protein
MPPGGIITQYAYELTDHLGNVRATLTHDVDADVDLDLLTGTDYYPFGLEMPGQWLPLCRSAYRFGYQGQNSEEDPETGYNSFELRQYDSRIGRWLVPDPYGQYWSPYLGMGNNPINYLDPDGGWTEGAGFWRNIFFSDARIEQIDNYATNNNISFGDARRTIKSAENILKGQSDLFSYGGVMDESGNHLVINRKGEAVQWQDVTISDRIYWLGSELSWATPSAKMATVSKSSGTINGIKSVGAAGRNMSNIKLIKPNMLKRAGIDAHALKTEFIGSKNISKFDLFKHTETGEVLILQKGGVGDAIFTGVFL